jgi:DNA (cytosine-5)-methyltransferase 1
MSNDKKVAGLFAGIGGLELGLRKSGFHAELLCEIDPHAQKVLQANFPRVPIFPDVTELKSIPHVGVLTAGFPCQDLSQAGGKAGIDGLRSSLISHMLRLVSRSVRRPNWIIIENVYYMLRLHHGRAMRLLTRSLEELGYRWAYRVVDARAFGVPQRRLRVILLAGRKDDPRDVLFADNIANPEIISNRLQAPLVLDMCGPSVVEKRSGKSYGFYWTEGRIGIGWTVDAVPTIKGGSGIGIPSPPAVWIPSRDELGVPSIRDAERLQGLPPGWTEDVDTSRAGVRWRLVGNAVCAHVSEWVGRRLRQPGVYRPKLETPFTSGAWPLAAHGAKGKAWSVDLSVWPVLGRGPVLTRFLKDPLKPLSQRAAAGFLSRARSTQKINYAPEFLSSIQKYLDSRIAL